MPKQAFFSALCIALLFSAGCAEDAPAPAATEDRRPLVVATTGIVADLVREVGGDAVTVSALMGPGVDPHLFKASEGDVRRLAEANLIVYNGLHLEGRMGGILEKMSRGRRVFAVADALPAERLREVEGFSGTHDPHVWFDVDLWSQAIPALVDQLAELLPHRRPELESRGEELARRYALLDEWVKGEVATIPAARRVLVTAHDAFGYFGARYGVEVVGLQGLSTVSEASLRDMTRVADLVSSRRLPAVFIESSVPRQAVEALRAACRDAGHEVHIGGELFSDSLGAPQTAEGSYEGAVRHNVTLIAEALR